MKLGFDDIVDKHSNEPVVVAGHGPSLDKHKNIIELLQKNQKIHRISVNNWFDFFNTKPDYWVLSNTVQTILRHHQRVREEQITLFYASSVDLSSPECLKKDVDYLPFDQRHFKGHSCSQIWENFHRYYEKEENYNFQYYGLNSTQWESKQMWAYSNRPPESPPISFRCCPMRNWTVQEKLQEVAEHAQHYSSGDTVLLHALAFAIIMGHNPIYLTGLDLDYRGGYAINSSPNAMEGTDSSSWNTPRQRSNLINDLRIINESARNRNIKIINLAKGSWYGQFEEGALNEE